jgi:hypothetical protein
MQGSAQVTANGNEPGAPNEKLEKVHDHKSLLDTHLKFFLVNNQLSAPVIRKQSKTKDSFFRIRKTGVSPGVSC